MEKSKKSKIIQRQSQQQAYHHFMHNLHQQFTNSEMSGRLSGTQSSGMVFGDHTRFTDRS